MRALVLLLVLLGGVASAAEREAPPPSGLETVRRAPAARAMTVPQRFRFAPQGDITTQELEQLRPYMDGKPLHEEDRNALGPAMRHLTEIK